MRLFLLMTNCTKIFTTKSVVVCVGYETDYLGGESELVVHDWGLDWLWWCWSCLYISTTIRIFHLILYFYNLSA